MDPLVNFAKATLSSLYDADATSITVTPGDGSKFPDPSTDGAFDLVWWNWTDYKDPADDPHVEIVRCTARNVDALTITRAQQDTVASAKNISGKTYKIILAVTTKTFTELIESVVSNEMNDYTNYPLKSALSVADKLLIEDSEQGGIKKYVELSSISTLLELNYTENEILTKLLTVDGTGSGLDADKLDGYEGEDYMRKSVYENPANPPQVLSAFTADYVNWNGIVAPPSEYPPESHNHLVAEIADFIAAVTSHSDVAANTAARHSNTNDPTTEQKEALDGANSPSSSNAFATINDIPDSSSGDMEKSDYDTNNDGKVNAADSADSVPWTGIESKPSSFPPSDHGHTAAEISDFAENVSSNTAVAANTAARHSNTNDPTTEQKAALDGAASPSGSNAFATINDIPSIPSCLPLAGGTMTGDINMGGNYIRQCDYVLGYGNSQALSLGALNGVGSPVKCMDLYYYELQVYKDLRMALGADLIFTNVSGHWTKFIQPTSPSTTTISYTLPGTNGDEGDVLSINGSGAMLWVPQTTTKAILNESEYDNGSVSSSCTIDWNNGAHQKITLTGNIALSFTDLDSGVGMLTLKVVQDASGGHYVTSWPSGFMVCDEIWLLSDQANAIDIIHLYYDGSTYFARMDASFYSMY